MSILIAEVGGTKSEWWYADDKFKKELLCYEVGFHPLLEQGTLEEKVIPNVRSKLKDRSVDQIYYYGTGVSSESTIHSITKAIESGFGTKLIEVESDIVGAARCTSYGVRSIVCILGTGSSSGLFDGYKYEMRVPSLGILAGDEGSGAYLGKMLIQAWIYNELSSQIATELEKFLEKDKASFIHDLYKSETPGRMLATTSFFVRHHCNLEEIKTLVDQNFDLFISRIIKKYPGSESLDINFVGSFAWHFKEILKDRLHENDLKLGRIIANPAECLLDYHINRYIKN